MIKCVHLCFYRYQVCSSRKDSNLKSLLSMLITFTEHQLNSNLVNPVHLIIGWYSRGNSVTTKSWNFPFCFSCHLRCVLHCIRESGITEFHPFKLFQFFVCLLLLSLSWVSSFHFGQWSCASAFKWILKKKKQKLNPFFLWYPNNLVSLDNIST